MNALPPFPDRYHPLSAFYRRRFGHRVYKAPVSTAQTCPNRQAAGGAGVCIFCDPWGSAAYPEQAVLSLGEQVRQTQHRLRDRYHAEKFLVYFQAYTNTFQRVGTLRSLLRDALSEPDVVGLVVGTRPDCLPSAMVGLLAETAREHFLSVELGLQTFDDGQLAFLSRGHDSACSLEAIRRLRRHPEIDLCVHLMFGLPGETDGQLRETARLLAREGVQGVKLHNLHVLKNTPLAELYRQGKFQPITLPEYARRVVLFLEHLSPEIVVHRLNAVASRWDEVVAPDWAREKLGPTQFIRDRLREKNTWQGRLYQPVESGAPWLKAGAQGKIFSGAGSGPPAV